MSQSEGRIQVGMVLALATNRVSQSEGRIQVGMVLALATNRVSQSEGRIQVGMVLGMHQLCEPIRGQNTGWHGSRSCNQPCEPIRGQNTGWHGSRSCNQPCEPIRGQNTGRHGSRSCKKMLQELRKTQSDTFCESPVLGNGAHCSTTWLLLVLTKLPDYSQTMRFDFTNQLIMPTLAHTQMEIS